MRDGAAYDVDANTWRPLTPAPVGITSWAAEATVVDRVLYVLVQPGATFLSYDVVTDRWVTLPAPPHRGYLHLLATHRSVLAYQDTHEHGDPLPDQAYDGTTGRWSTLPTDPLVPSFDRTMVWTGDRVVLLAPRHVPQPGGADGPAWVRAATLDPVTRTWQALPETRQVIGGWLRPVWTGSAVLTPEPGGSDGGEENSYGRTFPHGGRLDITTGRWTTLPTDPEHARHRINQAWGVRAASPAYSAVGSVVLDAAADRWLALPPPPNASAVGHSAAWVRNRLVVWGGARVGGKGFLATGAVWKPPTGH